MKNKKRYYSFHVAGHAFAQILTGIPFKSVTMINETKGKGNQKYRASGHIIYDKHEIDIIIPNNPFKNEYI